MFDTFKPIDTDTHITEPPDVWTARVSKKWGDRIPHIKRVEGQDCWCCTPTRRGSSGSIPEVQQCDIDLDQSGVGPRAG